MAGANSNIQLTDLDFNTIKNNLKTYLQSQDVLKDYNYEGSALSTILDILAYNTQYNAYYLNMVGNEMFLDSALLRSSVVSHAKLLNYIPKSATAPTATINLNVNQVNDSSLTLPKFTSFMSEAVDGVNYNFLTTDSHTVNVANNVAQFNNIEIKQGLAASKSFTVNLTTNPKCLFQIPDTDIDTNTLTVSVQQSGTNTTTTVYNLATEFLSLTGEDEVYFLQEGLNGYYEIYFGDNILGKQLVNGNIVKISYIVTDGKAAGGANSFVLMDTISGYANTSVSPITQATEGSLKETIDSIKYQAPKSYSAQNRAVTKEDYITAIQQNKLGFSFDAVNVWGGEENETPVYGQIFISMKPDGAYDLTQAQKTRIIDEVIKPISVMTVQPTIVDPDYTYIQVTASVVYDPKKTSLTSNQIKTAVTNAISNFGTKTLNTFNSTFNSSDLNIAISSADSSIVANEVKIKVQKKLYPTLKTTKTYKLYYNTPLQKGIFLSGITTSPGIKYVDPTNLTNTIDGVYIEELPSESGGVESISILNPGFGYQSAPTITILGDGTGATATAEITAGGSLKSITVTNSGSGYTSAIATITPVSGDTTGQLGAVVVNLQGRYGTLRSYYYDNQTVKNILSTNAGTVDYLNGVITLTNLAPVDIDNELGQLTVTANPTTSIISSSYNRIVTIDPYDPNAILVTVTAKS